MEEIEMFNNYSLSDDDVMGIIEKYDNLINKYSEINGKTDDDLKQEIIITIYRKLTKNREK